jgi:hypothetical protein
MDRFFLAKGEHRIGCPSDLKSPHLLEVFTFEEYLCTAHLIQGAAGEDGGAMDKGLDPFSGLSDVLYPGFICHKI